MLGSVHDAEDALQDALLRAWRGLDALRGPQLAALLAVHDRDQRLPARRSSGGRSACCRSTTARRPTRTTAPGAPLVESVWIEPYPDERSARRRRRRARRRYEQRESVELAFIAALQHLPARQRAVLILRDVLGFSGARGRRGARHDAGRRRQRAAAGAQTVDERLPGAEPAGDAARRSATSGCARSSTASSTRGSAPTSTRSSPARRGRAARDAADADLVPRPRRDRGFLRRPAAQRADALARRAHARERPAGVRPLPLGRRTRAPSCRTPSPCSRWRRPRSPRSRSSATPELLDALRPAGADRGLTFTA